MSDDSELAGYSCLPEPQLVFNGGRTHAHPLMGLVAHGPYGLKFGTLPSVRFALVAPERELGKLHNLIDELKSKAAPVEAKNYYPEYPGFERLLRTPIAQLDESLVLKFPPELDEFAKKRAKLELAQGLFRCISRLSSLRSNFDVALVLLPDDWTACFEGENFNFHD